MFGAGGRSEFSHVIVTPAHFPVQKVKLAGLGRGGLELRAIERVKYQADLAGGYDVRMRSPYFLIRAIAATIAVCAVTAVVGSWAAKLIRRGAENSDVGRISRGIEAITPEVERRDKEVKELIRP
jgi:hypothetical protein